LDSVCGEQNVDGAEKTFTWYWATLSAASRPVLVPEKLRDRQYIYLLAQVGDLRSILGDYRFRADKNGQHYWSAAANHCVIPGCNSATITTATPTGGLPWGGGKALAAAFTSPPLTAAPVPPAQATTLVERTIDYTHDPLNRLTAADYSTGEAYAYQYDAVGNRIIITSTTPLSGTVVTTYTYDAANRLTARQRSDGHAYTYDWSQRGQLLTEWTQGYPVRAFSYDGAGRMIRARVFTQTTEFVYNGLGDRVAVHVDGYGATTYVLDYAANSRILAETTRTETVAYLYGHECLGEQREDELALSGAEGGLYYLPDTEGYVRQGADAEGAVVSAWLFDPDGTVLEGPNGPVSHLICGGVYDWSTGLIYRGGRYLAHAVITTIPNVSVPARQA
jgi:YD repeat-containing protein